MAVTVSAMELALLIRASSQGFKAFKEAKDGVSKISAALKAMKSELIALGASKAFSLIGSGFQLIMRSAVDALNTFTRFDEQLARIAGTSAALDYADVLKDIAPELRKLAKTSIFTASEVASAFRFLTQAGLDTEIAMSAVTPTLNLATLAMSDMGSTADLVTDIMTAMGLGAEDLTGIADILTVTFQNSTTDIMQLGTAFSFVGTVARTLGVDLPQVSAALGAISQAGTKAGKAGRGLKNIFLSLAAPTTAGTKALENMGIEVFNAQDQFVGLASIIRQLNAANLTTGEQFSKFSDIVGSEAMPAFLGLINQEEKFLELQSKLEGSLGTSQEQVDDMSDSYFAFTKMVASMKEEILISIGETLVPMMKQLQQIFLDNEDTIKEAAFAITQFGKAIGIFVVPVILSFIVGLTQLFAWLGRNSWALKILNGLGVVLGAILSGLGVGLIIFTVNLIRSGFAAITLNTSMSLLNKTLLRTLLLLSSITLGLAVIPAIVAIGATANATRSLDVQGTAPPFQSGTGPFGVPSSGLFFLHKGEQVFNPNNGGSPNGQNFTTNSRETNINVTINNPPQFSLEDVVEETQRARMRLEMG